MKKEKVLTFSIFTIIVFCSLSLSAQPEEAVIIHWNDFHASNVSYKPMYENPEGIFVGGYANLTGYIDSLKGIYPDAIALNAGDDFQGSPVSSITKGMSQVLILNKVMPTVFTLGNHEFDYGVDNLKKALNVAKFPIVSSNIYDSTKSDLLVNPYIIVRSGKVRIAVIGFILKDLKQSVLPEMVKGIGIIDPLETVNKYVEEVNNESDLIVVLSHSGFEYDSLLALQLSDVDVIIGGHSHTILRQPVVVNNILVCQAGSHGRFVGLLDMQVNIEEKKIKSYKYKLTETKLGKVSPSQTVAHIVDSLESTIEKEMDETIGTLKTPWIMNYNGESNLGDWVTDVMRNSYNADIAFQNSGGIRKSLSPGPIKVRDIWEISPFDNTIMKVTLTGSQLKELLQWRIKNPRDLLQVSGLKVVYNSKTKKLISIRVNSKPLDSKRKYTFVTNNFVVGHFERFFGIKPEDVKIESTGIIGRDLLLKAVKDQEVIDSSIENRLVDMAK
ncbi:MAG: hypothetical protein DRP89_01955 [Candidatus Neomarinimicrobiota bacterium]|nr:MAG: hypothetical protein DRP89_01955 [Candidatus Neomarinimicrobiota bacterium]